MIEKSVYVGSNSTITIGTLVVQIHGINDKEALALLADLVRAADVKHLELRAGS